MLVFLALSRFRRRPPLSQLPRSLQADMRAFFGAYSKACREADELLFKAGHAEAIDEACKRSPIGKLLPDDLYIHRSALDSLEPLLRIYEGCGRAYLGEVEGGNIIKIHRRTGKLSYLVYPDFETDPHPALLRCVKLNLRTRQEEKHGLLDDTATIGTRAGWQTRLNEAGFTLQGHRLLRRHSSNAAPDAAKERP